MRRPARAALLLVLLLLGASAPAHASVYDMYGVNPRGLSMGQALTAAVRDYTAAYYNPAALATTDGEMNFGLGFQASFPQLDVDRALPFCGDGADACTQRYGVGGYSPFGNIDPRAFSGFTLGALTPFGGLLDNRVAFGICVYLPANNLIRAEGLDPQKPQFYAYQSLPDKFNILAALAYRPVDWVSLGVGVQVLANLDGSVNLDLDVLNHRYDRTDLVVKVRPKANLTAGLLFEPVAGLRIGAAYRGDLDLYYDLPVVADLGTLLELEIAAAETVLYTPHQISAGVSYELAEPHLVFAVDVLYAMWSLAPDPSPQVTLNLGGELLEGFGLADTLDVNMAGRKIDLAFVDTLSPRVGVEYAPAYWVTLRGGYFFRPTPAPKQTGATNYLDNDAHGVSLGVAFTFKDPFEVHPNPTVLDVGNQLTLLNRRTVYKTAEDDPVGDLSHGGLVYSVGISVSHSY